MGWGKKILSYIPENTVHLLLKNNWANFNQLGTKHPYVKGIQVCSKKGRRPFPRGDNYKLAKIH